MRAFSAEFENGALILCSGLPSTLIRHENGAFRTETIVKLEEFEKAGFAFWGGRKTFQSEDLRKR